MPREPSPRLETFASIRDKATEVTLEGNAVGMVVTMNTGDTVGPQTHFSCVLTLEETDHAIATLAQCMGYRVTTPFDRRLIRWRRFEVVREDDLIVMRVRGAIWKELGSASIRVPLSRPRATEILMALGRAFDWDIEE